MDAVTPLPELQPLPYQVAIRDYLQAEEREIWDWYAANRVQDEQGDAVRFDLLKTTYRIDRAGEAFLYGLAEEVAQRLGLAAPVTLYQAQNPQGLNASLAYLPAEVHVVFHGPVSTALSSAELQALLGHEISHYLLWQHWQGHFLLADQILAAMTQDAQAAPAHLASARLLALYNEIFCDRGAYRVTGSTETVVSMLLKVSTGLEQVSAESYLRQADEIFARENVTTEHVSHPEAFIRTRAIKLYAEGDPDANSKIRDMIEGPLALQSLDLLGQMTVASLTRRLIEAMLAPRWMHTQRALAQARLYFDDFQPPAPTHQDPALASDLRTDDEGLQDYYCYVLLDFVTADGDLEELPLAAALLLATRLNLARRFGPIAIKELKLRKRQFASIDRAKEELVARAGKGAKP